MLLVNQIYMFFILYPVQTSSIRSMRCGLKLGQPTSLVTSP